MVLRYQQAWGTASLQVTTPNLKKGGWRWLFFSLLDVVHLVQGGVPPTPGDPQGSSKSEHARRLAQTRPPGPRPRHLPGGAASRVWSQTRAAWGRRVGIQIPGRRRLKPELSESVLLTGSSRNSGLILQVGDILASFKF